MYVRSLKKSSHLEKILSICNATKFLKVALKSPRSKFSGGHNKEHVNGNNVPTEILILIPQI